MHEENTPKVSHLVCLSICSDEHDPFNRAPLKIEELRDDLVLKARIEKWIQQKLAGEETDEDKNRKLEEEQKNQDVLMKSPERQMDVDDGDYSSDLFSGEQMQQLKPNKKSEDMDIGS